MKGGVSWGYVRENVEVDGTGDLGSHTWLW